MRYEERKQIILSLLKKRDVISVQTLCEKLNSSEATVRRDIVKMVNNKEIERCWGGIKKIDSPDNHRHDTLQYYANDAYSDIGKVAAKRIKNSELIYIGSGTTTLSLIKYLDKSMNITVVTNGIPQLEALFEKGIPALLLCGFYKPYSQSLVGNETAEMMKQYSFDKAFFGSRGLDSEYCILSGDDYENTIKKIAIKNSRECYCLINKDKFARNAFYRVSPLMCGNVYVISDQPDKQIYKWDKEDNVYISKIKNLCK